MQSPSNVQKLEIVPLRAAFPHEAHSFTTWLEANIDALASRIGLELTVIEREKSVGSFNVDLFCETSGGRYAIVENQLEKSDHTHLGQLLTYLVNLEAKMAIWVTSLVRPEHQRVIDWLNESTSEEYSFYLVQVEAIRIGDSPYAPLFTVLAAPDQQTREIGETKKELADRHYQLQAFWIQMLQKSKSLTSLFSTISPNTDSWIETSAGRSGISLAYVLLYDLARVEIYIDSTDELRNKSYFDQLYAAKEAVEREIGLELDWQRLDKKRACRICARIIGLGGLTNSENWPQLQDAMIDTMIRFDKAFRPRIRNLQQ